MKNRKISVLLVLALIVSVMFAGCGEQTKDTEGETSEQVTVSQKSELSSLTEKPTASKTTSATTAEVKSTEKETSSETTSKTQTTAEKTSETKSREQASSETETVSADVSSSAQSSTVKTTKKTTTSSTVKTTAKTTTGTTTKTTAKTTATTKKTTTKAAKPVSASFFDDAVFVGDSVTLGLRNYATSERNKGNDCLGKAQFLTAGSMGYTNTLPKIGTAESIHPKYKGKETRIEDALKQMNAKKVFIMLGMNDFCAYPTETGVANAKKVLKAIADKNPGIKIYVESVTPTLYNKGRFTNQNINAFNKGLKTLCGENGWTYVDVASVMKDSNGNFIKSYCSDPEGRGVHMTYAGCKAWVDYLNKTFNK